MGIVEISIIWICGALMMQNYLNGMKLVQWKVFLGILMWPVVGGYIGIGLLVEIIKRLKDRHI